MMNRDLTLYSIVIREVITLQVPIVQQLLEVVCPGALGSAGITGSQSAGAHVADA